MERFNELSEHLALHTAPPPSASVPSLPLSFCGIQAASKTNIVGNCGPAPNPIRIRNIINKINALS